MDPKTTALILYIEQMSALLAKTILDLKGVIQGSNTKTVDEILTDADNVYSQIIANATPPKA